MPGRPLLPVLLSAPLLLAAAAPAPYPDSTEPEAVAAWIAAQTGLKLDQVVASAQDQVLAVETRPGAAAVAGGRRIRLRQEVLSRAFAAQLGGRSAFLDLDVDCAGRRVRRQAAAIYTEPNLRGAVERQGGEDAWTDAPEGSLLAAVVDGACDPLAPRPFDRAPTEPPPAPLPEEPAPGVAAAPEPAAPPAPPSIGLRGAQAAADDPRPVADFGDFATVEEAEAAWRQAAALSPALAGRSPKLEMVAAASGVRYRAVADGLGGRSQAEALCRTLRAAGRACRLRP